MFPTIMHDLIWKYHVLRYPFDGILYAEFIFYMLSLFLKFYYDGVGDVMISLSTNVYMFYVLLGIYLFAELIVSLLRSSTTFIFCFMLFGSR